LLKRHPEKPLGDTWGIPGGKLDEGETPCEGMLRELYEEVGIELEATCAEMFGSLYIEIPDLDTQYVFHMFYAPLNAFPPITLHLEEHLEARWVTPEEGMKLPLITGGLEALHTYITFINRNI